MAKLVVVKNRLSFLFINLKTHSEVNKKKLFEVIK